MKDERLDPEEIGKQLGAESVDTVVGKLDAYCACEERRIELTNAPAIAALEAEGGLLLKEKQELDERLRQAPPAFDARTRKRKAIYYWTVAVLLWATGLFSTMMSLAPFRLGWLAGVFCLGMAVASPFLIETALDTWNIEKLLKYLATGASVAALTSLMCFAVIRGNLLAEQLENSNEAVVLDDSQPTAPAPENHFYQHASPYLVFAMLMAAAAMEIGAGLSLYKAWKMSSNSGDDWQALEDRLAAVLARLLAITCEIKRLQNEAAVFEARFQRNFYHAMLTHTVRRALSKGLLVLLALLWVIGRPAFAQERLSLVVALDLTKSVAAKGPTKKTEFQANVDAITTLVSDLPAGSRVKVIGITAKTFTEPYVLLSAKVPADAGYFGEKLAAAHRELVNAWRAQTRELRPTFEASDILGTFSLAGEILHDDPGAGRKVLVIFSDMRQHTAELDLETVVLESAAREKQIMIPDLSGVDVYALGVDGSGRSMKYWSELKEFWSNYTRATKANLRNYSGLRDMTVAPQ